MKRLLTLLLLFSSPVSAEITTKYVRSGQIQVDMPYVVTNKAGSSYSLQGDNLPRSTGTGDSLVTNGIGGLNLSSMTNGVKGLKPTKTVIANTGSAFSKSESVFLGDATHSAVAPSSGIASLPVLSGQTTIGSGCTSGNLSATLTNNNYVCAGGGSGTSCITSTSVTITLD